MDIDFHKKRTALIIKKIDQVVKKAINEKFIKVEPYRSNVLKALKIVTDFISNRGRIIYGGISQNEFIKLKNEKDVFYEKDSVDIPDYDIYSPSPLSDLTYLANVLYDKGYHNVYVRGAVHSGTYTLRLDNITGDILDIHYVWKPHYNSIPKKKIGSYYYAHPEFMMIDMYKICTDPLLSFDFRIEKIFKRTTLLEQYYPIQLDTSTLTKNIFVDKSKRNKDIINKIITDYITKNTNIIISGTFCYNLFVQQINKKNKINIDYLTLITDDIHKVSDQIINFLIKQGIKDNVNVIKYHPFFELFDSKIHIQYNDDTLIEICGNMGRCVPYIIVQNISFISFHGLILYFYSCLFMYRFQKDFKKMNFIKTLIYNLFNNRDTFLKKHKLNGLEDGLFAELIINCKYKTIDKRLLHQQKIDQNLKKGKRPTFIYRPSQKRIEHKDIPEFLFPNTSGNRIKN